MSHHIASMWLNCCQGILRNSQLMFIPKPYSGYQHDSCFYSVFCDASPGRFLCVGLGREGVRSYGFVRSWVRVAAAAFTALHASLSRRLGGRRMRPVDCGYYSEECLCRRVEETTVAVCTPSDLRLSEKVTFSLSYICPLIFFFF